MAYEDLYTNSFYDLQGVLIEVDIKEKDRSGGSTVIKLDGPSPVVYKYNKRDRVQSTGVSVNVRNEDINKLLYAQMMAEPFDTFKLELKKAGSIYFEGFLLPQTFQQNWGVNPYVTLTFTNGLSMLEHIIPSFLEGGTDEFFTEMEILIDIFENLNLDYTIYVNSTLSEDDMPGGGNPLDGTYINRGVFQQDNGDFDDALTILNKILKSMNADCFIKGERIIIERFVDKATNPKTYWTYVLNSSSGTTGSSDVEAFTEKDLDVIKSETENIRYSVDQPIKQIKLKLKLLQFNNIFNNFFDREVSGTSGYFTFRWAHNANLTFANTNFSNEFITRGLEITNPNAPDTEDFRLSNFQHQAIITNPDDGMILSLKYKFYYRLISGKGLDFPFFISFFSFFNGTRYFIKTDGTISSTLTDALHTVSLENDSDEDMFEFDISKTFDLSGIMGGAILDGDLYVGILVKPANIYTIDDVAPLFTQIDGTITVTNGSVAIVGSGTDFGSDLSINDKIVIVDGGNFVYVGIVNTISDDTHLNLTVAYPGSTSGGEDAFRVVRDPVEGTFGDFSLNQTDAKINNLLEADLNNEAYKIVNEEVSLFDAGFVHYKANKLIVNAPFGFTRSKSWTDDFNTSETLQYHFLLNLGNLFNSSSSIWHMIIVDPDVDVFLDDIFHTALLTDDLGNDMKFYVDSLRYDIKNHKYIVILKKWLITVGKDIITS